MRLCKTKNLEAEFARLCPEQIRDHCLAVASRCEQEGERRGLSSDFLFYAGLFHDIGKAPELIQTGFHPLDGARYLLHLGELDLAHLVARHSGAPREAELLGLALDPWDSPADPRYQDLLDKVDLTTSPGGREVSLRERIDDICRRYGEDSTEAVAVLPFLR